MINYPCSFSSGNKHIRRWQREQMRDKRMPLFMPFAGFSPSCWADLVQMEHCADAE